MSDKHKSTVPILEVGAPHAVDRRSILALAWPVILTNVLTTGVQWVDLLMVAQLGTATVAAVGLAGFLTTLFWAVLMALQTGTQILVAQAYGARDRRTIDHVVQLALLLGGGLALLISWVAAREDGALLRWAFLAFDVEEAVATIGTQYMRIIMMVLAAMVVSLVAQAALRAVGDTRTPLWLTGGANLLNVFCNYVLIFGKFGAPAMGVEGAAWGTVIARALEALAYLALLYSGRLAISLRARRFAWDWPRLFSLLRLGAPSAGEQMVVMTGLLVYQRVIAEFGTAALAAYQVGVILLQAAFMPGFGFSVAATTLVGQWMGAGRTEVAREAGNRCLRLAVLLMSVMGVLFFIFAEAFARRVLDDDAVVPIAVGFIRVLALAQPFMAVHFALTGALRGAGDVRSPLLAAIFAMYLGRLPISVLAAFVFGGSITYAFIGMWLGHFIRSGILSLRWRGGRWKETVVLPSEPLHQEVSTS